LGRALAFHPPVLCLDEPLSALDDQTRGEIVAVLTEIRNRTGITILHITHNRSEAERLADRILPPGMRYEWTAMSYQEKLAGSASLLVFTLSLVLVYFVLAAQYESWITPLAVLLAVPLAVLGTVLALKATGVPNNIYVQIGLVLLIALSAKNAILVVEMARKCHAEGASIPVAAIQAARARFRPVMMTSLTFILGVLPLLLASGAGASARKCLGLAVASGMLASTCLAIGFVPSFFVVLQGLQKPKPR
jgi:HAE1 family hydrophobic/amphiphilic exporter-1